MDERRGITWIAGAQTPPKVYITRMFNFGTWDEWRAMKKKFSLKEVEAAVRQPLRGCWTRRGRALAEALYDCEMPDEAVISYDA